jgi:hypothetical protein
MGTAYEIIKNKLESNGATLISKKEDIQTTYSKIRWKCGCGKESYTVARGALRTSKCRSCGCKGGKTNLRKTNYDNILGTIKKSKGELLSDVSKTILSRDIIKWKCPCGSISETLVSSFIRCKGICGKCSRKEGNKPGPKQRDDINYDSLLKI